MGSGSDTSEQLYSHHGSAVDSKENETEGKGRQNTNAVSLTNTVAYSIYINRDNLVWSGSGDHDLLLVH